MADDVDVALSVDALGPRLTGIGRYCLELARRIPTTQGVGKVRYFRGAHWLKDPEALLDEGWAPERKGRLQRWFEQRKRRALMKHAVVHSPNYFLPQWAECGVATIHDLSVFLFPETHPVERLKAFEEQFERTLERATLLITDTETVRQELVSMFSVSADRIRAVPLGASTSGSIPNPALLEPLALSMGAYILCVSTFEPRKRIEHLVRAHRQLPLSLQLRFPLVLAGASGWHNDDLVAEIDAAAIDGSVRRLNYVDEPTLAALYAGTALFVYPSRYEGFGLPVIEAMAQGAPCLIADASCLIEVAKGAARVIQPEDTEGFAEALHQCLEDDNWRKAASQAGRSVAASYSWDACAQQTVAVYREAGK